MKATLVIIITILLSEIMLQSAQPRQLTGTVYGDDASGSKQPLIKATIQLLGTNTGTYTDAAGRFTLSLPSDDVRIIVSYIGYIKDTLSIPKETGNLEITLRASLETKQIDIYGNQPGSYISKSEIAKTETITLQGLRKAACCTLSESFVTNPSADVNYSDAVTGAKQIQLLGLAGIYSQILMEKALPIKGLATAFGLGYVPGPWMKSIQVSKGTASVATGFESIAGQINVEFKNPTDSEPLFVNLYANQLGRFEGDANAKLELSDEIGTMLLVHSSLNKFKSDENGDSFLDEPMLTQVNIMNRWDYTTDASCSQIGFKALTEKREGGQLQYYGQQSDQYYGIVIETERYETFLKSGIVLPTENYNSLALVSSAAWHRQNSIYGTSRYSGKQNSAYFDLLYETKTGDECESTNANMPDRNSDNKASHSDQPGGVQIGHKLSMGISYQYDEYVEAFRLIDINRKESVPGIHGEYTISGIYGFSLVSGLRADFHNLYGTFITPRFHLKYQSEGGSVIRLSAGKGFRIPNVLADNPGIMASSRQIFLDEQLKPEEAWNFGLNCTVDFMIMNTIFTLNAEYYRTNFVSQTIVDLDKSPTEVHIYNLKGESYSNSFQIDLTFELIKRLNITAAYRLNDVKTTINGILTEKPLISRHKSFVNVAYTTEFNEWAFDLTINYNGSGRLPSTTANPEPYRLREQFPAYFIIYSQITKNFDDWSIYIGSENLTGYTQPNPIISASEPFGKYFDSSIIWGPIAGRVVYVGLRYQL